MENTDEQNVLGTFGAGIRTALVAVGFVVLFAGIVTLAYPPLLADIVPGAESAVSTGGASGAGETTTKVPTTETDGTPTATPEPRGVGSTGGAGIGPTLFVSLGGIVLGLTVISTGLAMPGQSGLPLVGEQPYTRRQRAFVLGGAFLMLGVPALVWAAVQSGITAIEVVFGAGLLAVVGAVLVLLGTVGGLKHEPRPPQNS